MHHQRAERNLFRRTAEAEFPTPIFSSRCLLRLAADRFHVLFNPLFRVLFDFPSRYLSAIGLVGRYLALDGVYHPRLSQKSERSSLDCTLKQSDSIEDVVFLPRKLRRKESRSRRKNMGKKSNPKKPSASSIPRAYHPLWVCGHADLASTRIRTLLG